MGIDIIRSILQQSDVSGSKSTILKPLTWLISVLLASLLAAVPLQLPSWIVIGLSIALVVIVLLAIFSYVYCLFTDKDALRSESYTLKKMAIEKGIYGDDITGILKLSDDTDEPNLLNRAQENNNLDRRK
jgi:membrane protein YdbS with pleckstrin-like domain